MRVITGSAKGVKIETLEGDSTRPTADRVKQALFNILQFDIEGRTILDVFAGSGQLGIEALSRGAKKCTFLDNNVKAIEIIQKNIIATKLKDRANVLNVDALAYCKRTSETFDIVFLDPPYASDFVDILLPIITEKMNLNGTIVCETAEGKELPQQVGNFCVVRSQKYGKTHLWVYRS